MGSCFYAMIVCYIPVLVLVIYLSLKTLKTGYLILNPLKSCMWCSPSPTSNLSPRSILNYCLITLGVRWAYSLISFDCCELLHQWLQTETSYTDWDAAILFYWNKKQQQKLNFRDRELEQRSQPFKYFPRVNDLRTTAGSKNVHVIHWCRKGFSLICPALVNASMICISGGFWVEPISQKCREIYILFLCLRWILGWSRHWDVGLISLDILY